MANKNDALHLKKINSAVQPDNTTYATIKVDDLGRVVYNDDNGEKSLAYIEDISGGSGFTPLEGEGITITPSGDNYIFEVSDYISNTEVVGISGGLDGRITTIEDDYLKEADINDFITTSEVAGITGDFVQKSGDDMTGKLTITPSLSDEALQINSSGDASLRLNLPNTGFVEQSWAYQNNDLISSYLNSDGTNVFWGIYDYVLDNDIITYNRSTAIPDGSLSFNHPSTFSDSVTLEGNLSITTEGTSEITIQPSAFDSFGQSISRINLGDSSYMSLLKIDPATSPAAPQFTIDSGSNNATLRATSSNIIMQYLEQIGQFNYANSSIIVNNLQEVTMPNVASDGEIIITDGDGKLIASGTTINDIIGNSDNSLSVFEPFVIDSTPELVNITGSEYYTEIQQSYGNLIAIDADVGTYEEIDIRISSEWTTSQVGTFRLDLDVKSGQTFTFDSSIEGISDVTLPASGAASLLFDKPYNSSVWYVRQSI